MSKTSTNPVIPGCGFHHIALRARDFDRSHAFYTEGLGFKSKLTWGEGDTRAALLDLGDGNYLELFAHGTGPVPAEGADGTGWPLVHLAFRTSDVDGIIERVRAMGAKITMEPRNPDALGVPVRIAFFAGPDGELLELFDCAVL